MSSEPGCSPAERAAAAVDAVDRLRPDLMLLDLYLPDEHGLKLVARLRDGHPPVDVIVITAAKDADSVRIAMQGGALHYLLKPFNFPVLRDKLLSYAQMRTRLSALREADQRTVDRVFGGLRAPDQRYLSHLHEVGRVDIRLRYGSGGRPEHGYAWSGPAR